MPDNLALFFTSLWFSLFLIMTAFSSSLLCFKCMELLDVFLTTVLCILCSYVLAEKLTIKLIRTKKDKKK